MSLDEMRSSLMMGRIIGTTYSASMEYVEPEIVDFERQIGNIKHTRYSIYPEPYLSVVTNFYVENPVSIRIINQYAVNNIVQIICVTESYKPENDLVLSFASNVQRLERVAGPATDGTDLNTDPMNSSSSTMMVRSWDTIDGYKVVFVRDGSLFINMIANRSVAQRIESEQEVCS